MRYPTLLFFFITITSFHSLAFPVCLTPTITLGSNPSVCNGTTSASLTYSATTNTPTTYSISWSAAAIIAGFSNVTSASLPASPITLTVPSNPGGGTYTGTLTVTNACGFTSSGYTMSVTVNDPPTITLGSNPSVCNGTTNANLTYSATTNSPNQYQLSWSAAGIIAGFTNVSYTSVPASPISLTVPSNPGAGTYGGTLTVKNSTTGCTSTGSVISTTVNALPTITLGSNPSVCNGITSANLTYSATTSSPNQYNISWSAGAIIAGFTNVSLTSLPASPISLTVPSNPGAGTYGGTLTVKNSTTGCTSTNKVISTTVNALPTITLGSNPSVCNGTTSANLTYSATTSSPNQYSMAWSAAGIIAGFSNVGLTSLPASPISLTVPSNPGAGTYGGTLTVKNTTTGCSSSGNTTAVTVNAITTIASSATTQTQDVAASSGNYTDGSCSIISNVQPSGASPVSGNITAQIWIEPSVPTYGNMPFVARHYEITPATNATTATGTVTLYYLQSEFDAFNAAPNSIPKLPTGPSDASGIANLRIGKYSGTSSDNSGLPGSYTHGAIVIDPIDANIVWNASASRWEVTFDVSGFSGFIVQTNNFVLPVTWVSFTADKLNDKVMLKWQTTSETNSNHFEIEFSTDGHQFNKIGTVQAAGSSNSVVNYSFVHNKPEKEMNYYRIIQVDDNGHKNYSLIRMINFNISKMFMILVTPVRDGQLQVQFNQPANMAIFDAGGRMLIKQRSNAGSQSIDVSTLPHGLYLLKAGNETQKFIVD